MPCCSGGYPSSAQFGAFRLSPKSGEVVEFTVNMPVCGLASLPVLASDSKFLIDAYEHLLYAVEADATESEKAARTSLESMVKTEARKIYLSISDGGIYRALCANQWVLCGNRAYFRSD